MIRMEIALILVLLFIACMYFSAERPHTLLHKTFSVLLITVIVHLVFDAATIYTVNHLDSVPAILNRILHRMFIGTMALVVYLFYQYIAILVQEETGKTRLLDTCSRSKFLSKIFKIIVKNFREIFPVFPTEKGA